MRARHAVAAWLLGISLLNTIQAGAAERLAVYVDGPGNPFQAQFVSALQASYPDWQLADADTAQLRIALGDEAFLRALAAEKTVLGVLISRGLSEQMDPEQCRCSALWRGVPLQPQLQLLQTQMPLARRVAVLLGSSSAWRAEEVPDSIAGIQIETVSVDRVAQLGDRLRSGMPGWDALLLPVDGELFSLGNAKLILLTGYRLRTPVFGPDASYVNAGSVASLYPSGDDLVVASVTQLGHFAAHQQWLPAGFAGHYSLALNSYVAASFSLRYRQQADLQQALEARQ